MLGSVYCNGGKIVALNTQCPAPETYGDQEGKEMTASPSSSADNAQQAVADGCVSITCPEANKDKIQEGKAGALR